MQPLLHFPPLKPSQVVQFCIWLLFQRTHSATSRPDNILCHGFERGAKDHAADPADEPTGSIPGIVPRTAETDVYRFSRPPWIYAFSVLGDGMAGILQSLLLDCGVFVLLDAGQRNYLQISGEPLSKLTSKSILPLLSAKQKSVQESVQCPRKPNQITFVRSRIFYARPSLNGCGQVRFGLKHIHVLNRYPDASNLQHTVHVMKYVFPRQFGLHNVFTSRVDRDETSQRFADYTMREAEILSIMSPLKNTTEDQPPKIPRRLRSGAVSLIIKIQKLHRRCPYVQLFRYYCPVPQNQSHRTGDWHNEPASPIRNDRFRAHTTATTAVITERHGQLAPDPPLIQLATPIDQISAFCCAVFRHLLPRNAFGSGIEGSSNWKVLQRNIGDFLHLRRVESLTLHHVIQDLKINSVEWLKPPKTLSSKKMAKSDYEKRHEIFQEFVYYLFDSLLIPLLRTHFYITESASHGKRLFYFRHDVWRKVVEPAFGCMKSRTFEALAPEQSRKLLRSQKLGYCQLRLVPKTRGMRPIVNLSRRSMTIMRGKRLLGQSANKQLRPLLNALRYEVSNQPDKLGSALFSIGDVHPRIVRFAESINWDQQPPLYFVKLDIQSCFESIPQDELLKVVEPLLAEPVYRLKKRVEIRSSRMTKSNTESQPRFKYVENMVPEEKGANLSEVSVRELATSRRNTIFVDTGSSIRSSKSQLLRLLNEHTRHNIVRIGKKYLRQNVGIVQGSVLSSLLCSLFYAAFEHDRLSFIRKTPSLLLRLIDDFLLITTDKHTAVDFLAVMQAGAPEFGIKINVGKSLINFEHTIGRVVLPRLRNTSWFPYCGLGIHVGTLQVSRSWERKDPTVADYLTIERCRNPGEVFQRRVLLFLKIRMDPVLLDHQHNSQSQVFSNLFQAMVETAMKFRLYARVLGRQRSREAVLRETIVKVMDLAHGRVREAGRKNLAHAQHCGVTRSQLNWLGASAFEHVLRRKQTMYRKLLKWLARQNPMQRGRPALCHSAKQSLLSQSISQFLDHRF